MTIRLERSAPGTTIDRSPADLRGTWTIDPAISAGSVAWRTLGLWTVTGRRHCVGVIHLDALPAVAVVCFEQPSGLPVLTMALAPAGLEPGAADRQQQCWRLTARAWRSCPVASGGSWPPSPPTRRWDWWSRAWRSTPSTAAGTGWCCGGGGVLDRRFFPTSRPPWSFGPMPRLELAVHARRQESG
jgi:hypothetical protein